MTVATTSLKDQALQARAEKARREKSRKNLAFFCSYISGWWHEYRHLGIVADALEEVFRFIDTMGKEGIGRLIVEMPPRHGKTSLCSKHFPAWLLGKLPDKRVILTSYNADLATKNSRDLRNLVDSNGFHAVFDASHDVPVQLSMDSRAAQNWDFEAPYRGGCAAAGVGGGLTGKGAHLLVVDDPFASREDADSAAQRRRVLEWYSSVADTRLEPGAAVVMIHTRWHREDLIGQMLMAMVNNSLAEQWKVISLPALALEKTDYSKTDLEVEDAMRNGLWKPKQDALKRKAGDPLWPEFYGLARLNQILANNEARGTLREWYSLYQQQPRPAEGGLFEEKDFQTVEKRPDGLQWYGYVDLALGKTQRSDFNTCARVAMDADGREYVRDMIRVRALEEFKEQLITWMTSEEERGTVWGVENVAFQSLFFQDLMKDARLANVTILEIVPQKDKVTRARPVQARGKAGKLFFVQGRWVRACINEFLDFPNGKHDDQVDTISGGNEMVANGGGDWLLA